MGKLASRNSQFNIRCKKLLATEYLRVVGGDWLIGVFDLGSGSVVCIVDCSRGSYILSNMLLNSTMSSIRELMCQCWIAHLINT
jgi:hypothetical protein